MLPKQQRQLSGQAIYRIQQVALSKGSDHKAVKRCFDHAAQQVFSGHATVQSQGSASKGTGIQGQSDWDFIVRLTAAIPTVTQAQRMQFLQWSTACMEAEGIRYTSQPGQNRVRFFRGSYQGRTLPEIDVCFENFKGVPKAPPNNRAMAAVPNGHTVVRYVKFLPTKYTNLVKPKSMYLEDLVKKVAQQIPVAARQQGAAGTHALLTATLQAIAQQQHKQILHNARVDDVNWQHVATRVLKDAQSNGEWPWPMD